MKIYPTKKYSIDLINERSKILSELESKTLSEEQFVSNWNRQTFIGKIDEYNFEVMLSKKIYGSFCIFKGKLEEQKGTLEIEISKTFKIVFFAIFLFTIFGFLISLIQNGFNNSIELIFPTIMFVIILRFIFIEFGFKIISNKGVNELSKIMELKK